MSLRDLSIEIELNAFDDKIETANDAIDDLVDSTETAGDVLDDLAEEGALAGEQISEGMDVATSSTTCRIIVLKACKSIDSLRS